MKAQDIVSVVPLTKTTTTTIRGEEDSSALKSPIICSNCKEPNKPEVKFCANPKCGMILSFEAHIEEKEEADKTKKELEEIKTKVDGMYKTMEILEGIIDSKNEHANLLLHNDEMREIAKEVDIEMEQQERYEEELEIELAKQQDGEYDPVLNPTPEEEEQQQAR
jgi:hypothetical protein